MRKLNVNSKVSRGQRHKSSGVRYLVAPSGGAAVVGATRGQLINTRDSGALARRAFSNLFDK